MLTCCILYIYTHPESSSLLLFGEQCARTSWCRREHLFSMDRIKGTDSGERVKSKSWGIDINDATNEGCMRSHMSKGRSRLYNRNFSPQEHNTYIWNRYAIPSSGRGRVDTKVTTWKFHSRGRIDDCQWDCRGRRTDTTKDNVPCYLCIYEIVGHSRVFWRVLQVLARTGYAACLHGMCYSILHDRRFYLMQS